LQDDIIDIPRWVVEAQSGSSRSFDRLHRRYTALVHGVLLSRYRPAIADELTQECFLIAFKQLRQLRTPESFAPWLVAIARRLEPSRELEGAAIEDHEPHDPHNLEDAVDAERVLKIIRALPEAYRETLVLRLVEGMSGPEIAAETGLHPDSVRVNLHRGMQKLRDALGLHRSKAQALTR
jgi:RNA polymerase sigma-70 factor, ECF subfamily